MVQTPWLACGWFYTARSSDIGQRHDFMMRSMLYEMLESATPVFDDIKPLYRDFISSTDGAVEWNSDKLEIMLDGVRASSAIPATVAVIDGLDESENISGAQVDWEKALKILQRLVKNSNIRLVVLSRPESHIRDILKGSAVINLQQHNRGDISILIEDGICRLRESWPLSPDPDFSDEDEIYSAANGISDISDEPSSDVGPVARTTVIQMRVKDTEREQREQKEQREQMLDKIRQY
ncbi:hypothetical protein K456DRAFT_1179485 [Colletotrichum gloeosporioides 23]|nr:hypothetical protein K456DRAFT_1179485 [Colletotrichum gloeosporioides 23]